MDYAAHRGKWAESRVPHRGWECIFIDDLGEPAQTCEMCESQDIRYVHHMQHQNYPKILEVGCVCAGHMEENLTRAKARENSLRKVSSVRKRWPYLKAWTLSRNGNPMIAKYGYRITIFKRASLWSGVIVDGKNVRTFAKNSYETELAAKLAAFNGIMWLRNLKQ